jgi:glycerol-3-phosphate dehydrogenase subunit B
VAIPGVAIQAQGQHLDLVGSLHGPALDATAWPRDADPGFLEAVGARCDGLALGPRIFAAGDVVADKPRTILQAAFHGIHAGAAAAGEPGAIAS